MVTRLVGPVDSFMTARRPLKLAERQALLRSELSDRVDRNELIRDEIRAIRTEDMRIAATEASAARRWVISTAVAADLAGIWFALDKGSFDHATRLKAVEWFSAGVVAALFAGLFLDMSERDTVRRARRDLVDSTVGISEHGNNEEAPRATFPWRFVTGFFIGHMLESIPLLALIKGGMILLQGFATGSVSR